MSNNTAIEKGTAVKNSVAIGANLNEIKSAISSLLLLSKDNSTARDRIILTVVKNLESSELILKIEASNFAVYSSFHVPIKCDENAYSIVDKQFTLDSLILKSFIEKVTGISNKIILLIKSKTIDFIIDTNKITCKLFRDDLAEGNIDFNPDCSFNPFVSFSIPQEQLQRIFSLSQFCEQENKQKTGSALVNSKWVFKRDSEKIEINCFSSDSLVMSKTTFSYQSPVNLPMLIDLINQHEVKINDISLNEDIIESVFYIPGKSLSFLNSFINISSKSETTKDEINVKWNDSIVAFEWKNRKVVLRKAQCKMPNLDLILNTVKNNFNYTIYISKSKLMESIDIVQSLNNASQLLTNDFLDLEIKEGFLRMKSLAEKSSSSFLVNIFIDQENKDKYNKDFIVLCRITQRFKDLIRLIKPNTDIDQLIQWQETNPSQSILNEINAANENEPNELMKNLAFLFDIETDDPIQSNDLVSNNLPNDLITLHLQYTDKSKIFYLEDANYQALIAFRSDNLS